MILYMREHVHAKRPCMRRYAESKANRDLYPADEVKLCELTRSPHSNDATTQPHQPRQPRQPRQPPSLKMPRNALTRARTQQRATHCMRWQTWTQCCQRWRRSMRTHGRLWTRRHPTVSFHVNRQSSAGARHRPNRTQVQVLGATSTITTTPTMCVRARMPACTARHAMPSSPAYWMPAPPPCPV